MDHCIALSWDMTELIMNHIINRARFKPNPRRNTYVPVTLQFDEALVICIRVPEGMPSSWAIWQHQVPHAAILLRTYISVCCKCIDKAIELHDSLHFLIWLDYQPPAYFHEAIHSFCWSNTLLKSGSLILITVHMLFFHKEMNLTRFSQVHYALPQLLDSIKSQ